MARLDSGCLGFGNQALEHHVAGASLPAALTSRRLAVANHCARAVPESLPDRATDRSFADTLHATNARHFVSCLISFRNMNRCAAVHPIQAENWLCVGNKRSIR